MRFLTLIILLILSINVRASHIVGGDIYYDYLGGNSYRFYINLYRDCLSPGAQYDNPLHLAVYISNGSLVQNIDVPFPGSTQIPVVFNNPCVIPPNNICTELATYTVVLNLPPVPGGYDVSYQRCCRGPNVTNLLNPDDTGITLTCHVPGSDTGAQANSSPRFTNYPPLLLCNNEDLVFDHSATDPDGDQLSYSLVTPYAGASSFNPAPNPAPSPPYTPVVWAPGGFNAAQPLGPGSSLTINPTTGLLIASPNLTGLFVVGIQVEEKRNGVVINRTVRDFLFRVFNCNLQLEAILPVQTDLSTFVSYCDGLTVQFENNSYGGTNYQWDFGDPATNNDVSTAFEPTYTYTAPGVYDAMLVVNPGWPCTDTAWMNVIVNNEIEVEWTIPEDSLCIFDNAFDFTATSTGGQQLNYTWDFGANATPANATGETVNGVHFDASGQIEVTVYGSVNQCEAEYTDVIYVLEEPTAEMIIPNEVECEGLTIPFGNNSQNATNYEWDFGEPGSPTNITNNFAPTHTFAGPGTYTVTLSAWSSPSCIHSVQETITLNEPIEVSITADDEACLTDNLFDFDGTVSGPPNTVYTWNFGQNANIQTSHEEDVNGVSFTSTGDIMVTLTGTFDNCVEADTHHIYIYSPPQIGFSLEPGLQCVPFNAQFIDESWAETQIFYHWDFGDGGTSTEQNPQHLYTEVGSFPVTLSIATTEGCPDTLTLTQADLIDVHPAPVASFSADPDYTDICHSEIQFIDESIGGSEYFYWYDDSTAYYIGENANPNHQYLHDGHHYPRLIVTNEFGCKDTAYNELYIEPFVLYVPNTFTPDADEFNNTFEAKTDFYIYEWEMKIYNRWGQLLFVSYDPEIGWDGTFKGRLVRDGTYGYTIRYRTCEPVKPDHFITGHVNMLR